jgi:hypothetical protein
MSSILSSVGQAFGSCGFSRVNLGDYVRIPVLGAIVDCLVGRSSKVSAEEQRVSSLFHKVLGPFSIPVDATASGIRLIGRVVSGIAHGVAAVAEKISDLSHRVLNLFHRKHVEEKGAEGAARADAPAAADGAAAPADA